MRKILLNEQQFKRLIKLIKEQTEDDEYYVITPEELIDRLEAASYAPAVLKPKFFDGKKLYVNGNLDLSGKPIDKLINIAVINGSLDIRNTNISDVENITVKKYISDSGSLREKIRTRKEELAKQNAAQERRDEGEWDLDNPNIDDEGLMANALFQHLIDEGWLDKMDKDTKEEIESKKQRIEELVQQGSELEFDSEERDELYEEIDNLEEEIEDIQNDYPDVYDIIPLSYSNHKMTMFESLTLKGREYMVSTYDDAHNSAIEYQKDLYDEIGSDGIGGDRLEDYIDEDQVKEEIREYYDGVVRDEPEDYFDEDDFELTDEQEERKEQLENYINEMEDLKSEKEEELGGLSEDDEPGEMDIRKFLENNFNKKEIELTKLIDGFAKENNISVDRIRKFQRIIKLETEIEKIETNIDNAQDELDSIEPDTEPTEEMINEKVNDLVDGWDAVAWLKEMGSDLVNYVDFDEIARDDVDNYGIELMASYDGRYYEQVVKSNDKKHTFVIMRHN